MFATLRIRILIMMWLAVTLSLSGLTWRFSSVATKRSLSHREGDLRRNDDDIGSPWESPDRLKLAQLAQQQLRKSPRLAPIPLLQQSPDVQPRRQPDPPPSPPSIERIAMFGQASSGGLLVVRAVGNQVRTLTVGDTIETWRVCDFDHEKLTLSKGNHRIEMQLEHRALTNE